MERELALEFVRVTEAAALASGHLIGRGDKNGADQLAVDAMRSVLDTVHIRGTVVIGEGEMDEAPMLYIGEQVGAGDGEEVDIAVDPLEGTNLVAKGIPGAIAVMAVAKKGHLLHAPDMYMEKIVAGPDGVGVVHLDAPIEENLRELAKASGRDVRDLTVVLLDRERHQEKIRRIREAGARVKLISDGDVSPAIAACLPHSGVDMLVGSGGAPEGVIAAAAVKCLGGTMQGRLIPEDDAQLKRLHQMGVTDAQHVLTLDDLVRGDDAFYVATGITDGDLLKGVQYGKRYATTYSVVMRLKTGTVRYITTQHRMDRMASK
ncbi:class II fructose-bisphosphatase [Sulfobacillus thermosulfidooxidans]|uniref:Fructose-1,6-bisphosphatase n=2 Tax=Sulfobacillus thermosulfidooxidans TaxID=28034 RepID=A0A1W1WFS9_SULTA|nr:class II fructose-bisphosphatase [Sulfobacillus thermosulfidooxidans]OLZ08421.1 fructose-bisphosphatase, class II [Sulfobacillus thermosulfidooxidans]OLZ13858.1 fructose-bisphosphatase, class II [Sulfobacillus thermosulfidooxidans]OLZ20476.1 fructose-bisphosphatase, class II [Sulfobacillus thermosulfidooxidans]PSR24478.1 MAG: fructose-bisphosphatase class II [Sulfobacillus thermosulfidooxidans]SMC05158.1 fructose-1,6-bisphosphatase II [Sulfobacillus thermosulfidooxidans DSM 9293]